MHVTRVPLHDGRVGGCTRFGVLHTNLAVFDPVGRKRRVQDVDSQIEPSVEKHEIAADYSILEFAWQFRECQKSGPPHDSDVSPGVPLGEFDQTTEVGGDTRCEHGTVLNGAVRLEDRSAMGAACARGLLEIGVGQRGHRVREKAMNLRVSIHDHREVGDRLRMQRVELVGLALQESRLGDGC